MKQIKWCRESKNWKKRKNRQTQLYIEIYIETNRGIKRKIARYIYLEINWEGGEITRKTAMQTKVHMYTQMRMKEREIRKEEIPLKREK